MRELAIGFVTLGLKFEGDTLSTQGMGGSETALICMARELAKRGHRVSVFCNTDRPGKYDGVTYYSHSAYKAVCNIMVWDVLISSRWPEFLTNNSYAGARILWCHDTLTDRDRIMGQTWQVDQLFLLSDYHISDYTENMDSDENPEKNKAPWLRPFMWKTSNGVDLALIEANKRPKIPNKVIYTSRPERGLRHLLQHILPNLLKAIPDLKLYYCNYSLQNMQLPDHVRQEIELCDALAKKLPNNVVPLGHLTKDLLYQEISSAQALLYPTSFPEISCITAMEAAACGTPIVSTNDFALKETVSNGRTGFLINGKPTDGEEYYAKFTRKALQVLRDTATSMRMQKEGPKWIAEQGYTWDKVAERWEEKFFQLMEERWEENRPAIITELVRNSDLVRAREISAQFGYPERAAELDQLIEDVQEVALIGPLMAEEVTSTFKASMPKYRKLAKLMLSQKIDPAVVWDFDCTDAAFSIFMAKASSKCKTFAISADVGTLNRVKRYATDAKLENLTTVLAASLLEAQQEEIEEPDFLFLGNLDLHPQPWKALAEAARFVKPGGSIGVAVGNGARSAIPTEEHSRLWNIAQEDFYAMFGDKFPGTLSFQETGLSPGGDIQGNWLAIIPIADRELKTQSLLISDHLERSRFVTRPYQSIGCCVISRDDEDWIFKFVKPLLEVVDKLYITIDSRTTDRTEEFLRMLDPTGARIEVRSNEFDHFAAQRNFSKDGCPEDWIFWIDTDEILADGARLRRYLNGPIMEGFSIKQCHLMLDVHGTFDTPIRIFRNREHFQFVGCIHEHCEDISKGVPDSPIQPAVLIPNVNLAHYGYLHESQRRDKCSNRNMHLLQRDLKENPDRLLNKVLAIRDYINIVKWQADRDNLRKIGIQRGSEAHNLLEAAIKTYHKYLANPKTRYHGMAEPMYQEALAILGSNGVPFEERTTPPFSIGFVLTGAMGGSANVDINPQERWFLDETEYMEFMEKQNHELLRKLEVTSEKHSAVDLDRPSQVKFDYSEDTPELLGLGADAIDSLTGQMR